MTLSELAATYRPYCDHVEFKEGFVDYQLQTRHYDYPTDSVAAQAYDRGLECAMKWERMQETGTAG